MKQFEITKLLIKFFTPESYINDEYWKGLMDGLLTSLGFSEMIGDVETIESYVNGCKNMQSILEDFIQ